MPTTVNGIGTHYYGKSNRVERTAPCRYCNRVVVLESYGTRLWFVVIFIPIIPLGRKRIIDRCPACTRHIALDADKYEQARQLQTSGSMEQFRREPSVESALEAHGQLLTFHEHEQAAGFREAVLERFPDDAELRAGLASHLEQAASYGEAAALYDAALELDPDLPEARMGVALKLMGRRELEKARALLDFLEVPGAGQHYSLGLLDTLSTLYQQQGRHEEALELAGTLLRELPQAGHRSAFRAFVRRSEKALRREESILPPLEHSLRGLFRSEGSPYPKWLRVLALAGLAAFLLSIGLFINNEYIRRHRTLHVVNACGQPVRVQVDDGPPQQVDERGQVALAEGQHRLRVTGAVDETHDVELRTGFFDRWSGKPLWVLNPGAEAVLAETIIFYARPPRPPEHRLIVGRPFVALDAVDYPFEEPPQKVRVEGANDVVIKKAVSWVRGNDPQVFDELVETDPKGALDFAERRLRRSPEQPDFLEHYIAAAFSHDEPRAEAFLETGLDRRPVSIPWHRAYQSLVEASGKDVGPLVARYDGYLKAEPPSAALLYLRGRIDPDWDRQDVFYRKAAEEDPTFPWPWMALGVRAGNAGRWEESVRCLKKAQELQIEWDLVREPLHVARLASGEANALVTGYRVRLAGMPYDIPTLLLLVDALVAAGQADQIETEITNWSKRVPPEMPNDAVALVRAIALYQAGRLEECEARCRESSERVRTGALRLQSLLALGRAREVAADSSFEKGFEDPSILLAVSLGLRLEGQPDESDRWRDRAIKKLGTLTMDHRKMATFLSAADPPAPGELGRISMDADDRALVLALLAERFPAKRAEYHADAARFNVQHKAPYHLIRRALEGKARAQDVP